MINVAVNGYGTIGKRVADAIIKQPDMKLVGVAKTSPNYEAFIAHRRGYRIYALPQQSIKKFEESGIPVAGTVDYLIKTSDIVVDTTPNGVGAQYKPIYLQLQRNAIFQGGEKAEVADISFSALCNYNEALGKKYIRVVSCNTTALLRTICTVNKVSKVENVRATIVRRAADQKEVKKGPINSLVPDPATVPSHHAKDVNSVIRNLDIATMAVIAPTTLMHMHFINITLKDKVEKKDILSVLENTPRIVLISSKYDAEATAELVEVARDLKRDRNDIPEVMIFSDSIYVKDDEVMLMYAVHQESIVVPENIDAIRASMKLMSAEDSMRITNESLGILKGYLI
nr:glyceraldehyde 3-phosphate dehydrogenase [Saccharolobus solfataricus]prf//2001200A glyceraldehyde phosphate dehydrogenase [Saccharolobus solfataricus]